MPTSTASDGNTENSSGSGNGGGDAATTACGDANTGKPPPASTGAEVHHVDASDNVTQVCGESLSKEISASFELKNDSHSLKSNTSTKIGIQKQKHIVKSKGSGRGPGRPPGSLNRSTIARLKAEAEAIEAFKRSNPDIPTYTLDQLNISNDTKSNPYIIENAPNNYTSTSQYYLPKFIPGQYPEQSLASYSINVPYTEKAIPYQVQQTSRFLQPYPPPPPPPPPPLPPPLRFSPQSRSLGKETELVTSVAMQTGVQGSLSGRSDWTRRNSENSNRSGSGLQQPGVYMHSRNVSQQSSQAQLFEQISQQQQYTSNIPQQNDVYYYAYTAPVANYQGSSFKSIDNNELSELPQQNATLTQQIQPLQTFGSQNMLPQSYPSQTMQPPVQHGPSMSMSTAPPTTVVSLPPVMQQLPPQYSTYPLQPNMYQQRLSVSYTSYPVNPMVSEATNPPPVQQYSSHSKGLHQQRQQQQQQQHQPPQQPHHHRSHDSSSKTR